uniref:NADH-ubiquinone oxidoreductase chain 5 n=1 Tax=prasinophyte sp. MBIC10622 TaxID=156113 RepID=A0A650AKH9_9CHLO|nr:NADH dehydrogenase subunit 5 [prasinophyte sp. MBIC10622]
MYLLIILLPLLGSLFAGGCGRYIGARGAALITTGCVATAATLSTVVFYEVALSKSPCTITLAPWIFSEMFDATWGFLFDTLTAVMLIVVTYVSTLVHVYSISYMAEDPHVPRFMSYLSIFTFFMLMLITGDNFIQLFLGWEGVGLASYLLINFWFTRIQANKSAIKAMLVNRVGDFGLALGIMGVYFVFKSVDYATVFACASQYVGSTFLFCNFEVDALNTLCILLFVGAVGKSAQLGLHTWLPDAMEGPTPVSALIHAATMVTAGVFLLARCSPIFEFAPQALIVVTCVGAMTAFFAATTGVVQNDLKRVIAYSTCSQLGYMVFACGLSSYSVGVFHLMNHAFFKALLFLSAGSVIHALSDEQDMRKMGGLVQLVPLTYAMMLIGSLALVGFPFLTGFYSKDVILELSYAQYTIQGNFAYWLGMVSAFCTSYYSFRLIFLTFLGYTNSFKPYLRDAHESPFLLAFPLMVLAFGSIFVGYMGRDMLIGLGTDFWGNALFTLPQNSLMLESEFIPQGAKLAPFFVTFFGAFVAFVLNYGRGDLAYSMKTSVLGRKLYAYLNKRWLFDKVYNDFLGRPALAFGYEVSFKALDKGAIEILGPYGVSRTVNSVVRQVSTLQSGYIYHYAFAMLVGLTVLITVVGMYDSLSGWVDARLYPMYILGFLFYTATAPRAV